MKSPENSVGRPPALVENPGFRAVVLCCSVLFCAVAFFFRVGTKSCPVLCKRSQTKTKTSEIVGTSQGENGTAMLDYKQKNHLNRFIPFTSSVDF